MPEPFHIDGATPDRITLSEVGWAAFVAAIENPPEPNAELKKMFDDFQPAEPTGIEQPEISALSSTDWAALLAAIESPPKANPKLKKLLRDYKPAE